MAIDPSILDEFRHESNSLVKELQDVVERFEDEHEAFPDALLTEYAQKIDRIMGAAKTMAMLDEEHAGLKSMGSLAEICKSIGYKATEKKDLNLMPFFSAFLADTLEVIAELLENLEDTAASAKIAADYAPTLQNRLAWLKTKTH